MAIHNRYRSRPIPTAAPPPSVDEVTQLIQARNNQATGIKRWTLTEAHNNLGHRNPADILSMYRQGLLHNIELTTFSMPPCAACLQGVANFHTAADRIGHRATKPLERVLLDFFVAGSVTGSDGSTVVLYILDEATRYLWVHAAASRTACVQWFLQNLSVFERQARASFREIVTDNAPEFLSQQIQHRFSENGIEQSYSVAHEKVHNGAVERTIKTITQFARRTLAAAALPARSWPFAVRHSVFIYNRLPHAALDHKFSPYAALYHQHPRLHHLLPFGVLVYYKRLPTPSKLDPQQASLGVFLVTIHAWTHT
jgi:transposase InsO family protein